MSIPSDWRARVRQRLADQQLSKRKAAILCGLSPTTFHDAMRDGVNPRFDTMQKLLSLLEHDTIATE